MKTTSLQPEMTEIKKVWETPTLIEINKSKILGPGGNWNDGQGQGAGSAGGPQGGPGLT